MGDEKILLGTGGCRYFENSVTAGHILCAFNALQKSAFQSKIIGGESGDEKILSIYLELVGAGTLITALSMIPLKYFYTCFLKSSDVKTLFTMYI